MKPVIAILGVGCLGTLVAYHLQRYQPLYFPRQRDSQGNAVLHRQLLDTAEPATVLADLKLMPATNQPIDWLIVTTKAADTQTIYQQLDDYSGSIKNILLLQNGMGQQQHMADWLQQQQDKKPGANCQLWVGSATEGAFQKTGSAHIKKTYIYAGHGHYHYGPWRPLSAEHQNNQLLPTPMILEHDMPTRLFKKLAINAVINPLTAYYRCLNGELVSQPKYRQQLLDLAMEVTTTFSALGWTGAESLSDDAITVAQATAKNRSSTLQDVENNNRTELASITGYIIQSAQQIGFPTPLQSALLQRLARQGVRY